MDGGSLEVEVKLVGNRDKRIANCDFGKDILGLFGFICFETGFLAL